MSKEKKLIPLVLGKMKTKEIAQWFGIAASSYNNRKEEKLAELANYAAFDNVYGGVIIKEIYGDIYYDKDKSINKKIIKLAFDEEWSETGLDTCANVSEKIYNKHKEELTVVKDTAYNYTLAARNQLYGRPYVERGRNGTCVYLWCKKEIAANGTIILTEFTPEEQAIKSELMKKFFSTDVEREVWVAEMVERKEISKEEAYDILCEMKGLNREGFMGFKAALEEALGCNVVKGTRLEKNLTLTEGNFTFLGE